MGCLSLAVSELGTRCGEMKREEFTPPGEGQEGDIFSGKDAGTTDRVVTGIPLTRSSAPSQFVLPTNPSGCFQLSSEEEKEAWKGQIQDSHLSLSAPQISAFHLALT